MAVVFFRPLRTMRKEHMCLHKVNISLFKLCAVRAKIRLLEVCVCFAESFRV